MTAEAIPCRECGQPLTLGLKGHDGEGYCRRCQVFKVLPLADDNEDAAGSRHDRSVREHQLGALATAEGRQDRPEAAPVEPVLVTVGDVERQEVSWLWPSYIPRGRLTLLDGDPAVGKSWLALAIAAAVTRGAPWPGETESREAAWVLVLTAEDGIADTVRPRLEDMGADLQCVRVLTAVRDDKGNERHVSLVEDMTALEMALAPGGYGLVIIDPINAYLGFGLDTHRDASLRAVLTPLAQLAERRGVAIICIRHLTKSPRDRAIYRGQGNIAYTAAARVVHLVGQNPDDPHERVMACIKNNLAPLPPALAFELTEGQFLWRGESYVEAAALLRPDAGEGERTALAEAQGFLQDILADGPVEATTVIREAKATMGVSERTLRTAKAALGVKSDRRGFGPGSRCFWALPAHRLQETHSVGTLQPIESSNTKTPQQGQEVAAYGGHSIRCPHRPPGEAEERWQRGKADPDPCVCACCGAPVRAELWQDGLCPVCRNGRGAKQGSGHLVRLALDMGARATDQEAGQ